jgi:hypothetical protein
VIISEVKCSQRLYDDIAKKGGQPIMWKAGHSLLKAKMKETGALLAGEMSGHMFFKERYFGFDDAIYASLRLLEIVANSDKPLSRLLADLPQSVSTPEIRVDCPDEKKFAIAAKATEYFRQHFDLIDIDGARVRFADGWGLIRASNTQPALVLRFEASSQEKLDEYRALIENKLQELVVITGPSGSGKSSLAFDTLYAEGRRRYLEAIAADAHQLLQQIEKPDVDSIEGLSPTIAIQQSSGVAQSRSTVGTLTHIYDFLRLLFVRAGQLNCPNCGSEIIAQSTEQIVDQLLSLPHGTRLIVLAPLALSSEMKADKLLEEVARQGFSRAMVDGKMVELPGTISDDWSKAHQLDVVIDRLMVREGIRTRLAEAVELAGRQGDQIVKVLSSQDL